ncbi:hypothetical protein BRETT_004159 [Brettanomyces bruxellensis]|uniref:UspA domain-containing protein n=1 Tax=Dekkera bruxellensis TaxID=5007 RepID=A0A871R5B5_DEKBR|nr:uncharacterized protein BRETT_004159 [Brettanomyces bruxellensis]QOU18938.1 hypothetical protein BRETT_004159 [Brettanomyces bruxellensis]
MSLEGAMEEERRLISQILERQRLNSVGVTRDGRRNRGNSPSVAGAVSRSLSVASEAEKDQIFTITARDPSFRMMKDYYEESSASEGEEDEKLNNHSESKSEDNRTQTKRNHSDTEDEEYTDDETEEKEDKLRLEAESSDEEQISDTDTEFEFDDDGNVLPNYSTYNALKAASPQRPSISIKIPKVGKVPAGGHSASISVATSLYSNPSITAKMNSRDELVQIHNRKLVKDAIQAEKLDEVVAAERAAANARAIGRDVSTTFMKQVMKTAEEAGSGIHVDPEKFYRQNPKRREKLQEYAKYKKKITSDSDPTDGFAIPYTRDFEEKIDSELAKILNENIKVSDIESFPETQRSVRTITRGNFFEIVAKSGKQRPRTFILCMDFSDESSNALEWCIGTVLVDGCVLYIMNVIEDEQYSSMHLNGIEPTNGRVSRRASIKCGHTQQEREKIRAENVNKITKDVLSLLKLTKLQVHVVIQSSHHPIPRHFIVCVIKEISPTLVIVGSRGKRAIKGILMGSLSSYMIRKSPAPVMVVKHKLKKLTKKDKHKNDDVGTLHSLAEARVD